MAGLREHGSVEGADHDDQGAAPPGSKIVGVRQGGISSCLISSAEDYAIHCNRSVSPYKQGVTLKQCLDINAERREHGGGKGAGHEVQGTGPLGSRSKGAC